LHDAALYGRRGLQLPTFILVAGGRLGVQLETGREQRVTVRMAEA